MESLITQWSQSDSGLEVCKRLVDLFLVSVLLDAGAGNVWHYSERDTGDVYSRSEGLAIASLDMFKAGTFSSKPEQPFRVDGRYSSTYLDN